MPQPNPSDRTTGLPGSRIWRIQVLRADLTALEKLVAIAWGTLVIDEDGDTNLAGCTAEDISEALGRFYATSSVERSLRTLRREHWI